MMTLDMDFVEGQFPALKNRDYVYFDNAAGALVLGGVARRREDISMGSLTAALFRMLSTALRGRFGPGDEVAAPQVEPEANVGAWRPLESAGVKVRIWPIGTDSMELSTQTLAGLMTKRAKLVCVNHVSSILGAINPIREFADVVHEHGARISVDAVAYAARRLVDVQAFGADYRVFSFFKTDGPHHAQWMLL